MYDLGSSQLPTSFDPATDSDQHSLREFIDPVSYTHLTLPTTPYV